MNDFQFSIVSAIFTFLFFFAAYIINSIILSRKNDFDPAKLIDKLTDNLKENHRPRVHHLKKNIRLDPRRYLPEDDLDYIKGKKDYCLIDDIRVYDCSCSFVKLQNDSGHPGVLHGESFNDYLWTMIYSSECMIHKTMVRETILERLNDLKTKDLIFQEKGALKSLDQLYKDSLGTGSETTG